MKTLLNKLLKRNKKQERLQQQIIPNELLETQNLSTLEITEEMFMSADVFDYSPESFEGHKIRIQRCNLIQRQLEMADLLGIDWYFQTREDAQRINDNIVKCQTLGRIDGLYNIIEKE